MHQYCVFAHWLRDGARGRGVPVLRATLLTFTLSWSSVGIQETRGTHTWSCEWEASVQRHTCIPHMYVHRPDSSAFSALLLGVFTHNISSALYGHGTPSST